MPDFRGLIAKLLGIHSSQKAIAAHVFKRVPIDQTFFGVPNFSAIDHLSEDDWNSLNEELAAMVQQRSDRGVAITAHALLDDRLRWALEKCLIDGLSNREKADLFDGTSPLATYAARVRMAHALGLINADAKAEFLLLGKIRNKFAHEFRRVTFDDPKIAAMCRNLKIEGDLRETLGDDLMKWYGTCCFAGMVALLAAGAMRDVKNHGSTSPFLSTLDETAKQKITDAIRGR